MNPAHRRRLKQPSPSRHHRSSKLTLVILAIIALIIFAIAFIYQIKTSFWKGEGRLTLVIIQGNQVGLLSYDPGWDKALWLPFPESTQVTSLSYGKYPINSLWKLGEQEKRGGGKLLTHTLQWELGIGIDGYIKAFSQDVIFWDTGTGKDIWVRARKTLAFFFSPKTTNLSYWDLAQLGWKITGLRSDKIPTINLETASIGKRITLADGQEVFQINPELFHSRLGQSFVNSQIQAHPLQAVITNRTPTPGLAAKAALIINSTGGQVIKVETSQPEGSTGCRLITPPSLKSILLVRKLVAWFDCQLSDEVTPQIQLTFHSLY